MQEGLTSRSCYVGGLRRKSSRNRRRHLHRDSPSHNLPGLSANSTTTNSSFTTIFNITGLPAVDGTLAIIKASSIKGTTTVTEIHTVVVEIAGVTIATPAPATNTTAQTVTRAFTLDRINGTWTVVGETGSGSLANTVSTATTADYAEWIPYSGDTQPQPGDVLTLGDEDVSVKQSAKPYDSDLLGVVSTDPYEVGGKDDGHSVVIALNGRVPVKVNLENGPINKGDRLTSSSTPGEAMKATTAGRVIGTALTSYDGSQASNEVTLQLGVGYDNPSQTSVIDSSKPQADGGLALTTPNATATTIDTGSYVSTGSFKPRCPGHHTSR